MKQNDIFRLALQAGFKEGDLSLFPSLLTKFADLVAAEVEDYKATNDVLMRQTSEQIGEIVALKELNRELLVALKACDEAMSYMSEYDIPLHLPFRVKAAIAKAEGANND